MKIHRDKRGKFRCGETVAYKMTNHFGQFNREAEEAFNEAALEKYDFGACKNGEKMTFGKCAKVGGSSKNAKTKKRLEGQLKQAEANLASAQKRGSKKQMKMFSRQITSYNNKIASL